MNERTKQIEQIKSKQGIELNGRIEYYNPDEDDKRKREGGKTGT